jgi:hypothetical protein
MKSKNPFYPAMVLFEQPNCIVRCCIYLTTYDWSLATGRWFSPGTPVSSTNKTDRHDIAEILLKVALNTMNMNLNIVF